MRIERALIIAPHPDDEINLAGQAIIELNKAEIKTYILYTTNGNADKKVGNRRIRETIHSLSLVNIGEDHIIFLGYANEWKGSKHIYNAQKQDICTSSIDTKETDSISSHPEFCYEKDHIHHKFTRENFKEDMKKTVRGISADLIICVDFDRHADHRAASLMFDEIMGEILKENSEYRPFILKKFAYNGVWFGKKDYYVHPFRRTYNEGNFFYSGQNHELEAPNLLWAERKSYKVDASTKTNLLHKNILYKMAKMHRSTTAWWQMQRVINADMIYWERKSRNLLFKATISASSGDVSFINDFKYYDTADVYSRDPFLDSKLFCWSPDEKDDKPIVEIQFPEPVEIRNIYIWEDCNVGNHIESLDVYIQGERVANCEPEGDGSCTKIELLKEMRSEYIEIRLNQWIGRPGIAEIEILEKEERIENFPFSDYEDDIPGVQKTRFWDLCIIMFERVVLSIAYLFKFKIKYEVKRRISRWGETDRGD